MSIREMWREAAQRDQRQVFFIRPGKAIHQGTTGEVNCAISLVGGSMPFGQLELRRRVRCPVEGCEYEISMLLSQLAVHLNNIHQWDWLTLANKFPPILPEDAL